MIDKNELRIGNIVNTNTYGESTIIGLSMFDECIAFFDMTYYPKSSKSDNLFPIPISDTYLSRLGFNLREEDGLWVHEKYAYIIYEEDGKYKFCFFEYGDWEVDVKYVHRLQNLIYELNLD